MQMLCLFIWKESVSGHLLCQLMKGEKKGKKKEIKGKTGREGKEKRKRKENGKGEKRKGKIGK